MNVLSRHSRQVLTLVVVILSALAYLTWRQVQIWSDPETLWTKAMAVEPSFIAANNLGIIFEQRHDYAHAIDQYRMALQMNPYDENAHHNLGWVQVHMRNWDAAANEFGFAIRLRPTLASAHQGQGIARMNQGRLDEAIEQFRIVLRLNPGSADARNSLNQAMAAKASTPLMK